MYIVYMRIEEATCTSSRNLRITAPSYTGCPISRARHFTRTSLPMSSTHSHRRSALSTHLLPMKTHLFPKSTHALPMSKHALPMSKHALSMSTHALSTHASSAINPLSTRYQAATNRG